MNYWFTSDEHYNHDSIITKFEYRKFKNVTDMNNEIIYKHNVRVKDSDVVFHLGDFKLTINGDNCYNIKKKLNGTHIFILGNHDRNNGNNTPIQYCVIKMHNKLILLTHKPDDALSIMSSINVDLAFVGHVHSQWKIKDRMINVGLDQWDFYPVDAKQILKYYYRMKNKEERGRQSE